MCFEFMLQLLLWIHNSERITISLLKVTSFQKGYCGESHGTLEVFRIIIQVYECGIQDGLQLSGTKKIESGTDAKYMPTVRVGMKKKKSL